MPRYIKRFNEYRDPLWPLVTWYWNRDPWYLLRLMRHLTWTWVKGWRFKTPPLNRRRI